MEHKKLVAIEIGMRLACLLFMKRMSDETSVKSWNVSKSWIWKKHRILL